MSDKETITDFPAAMLKIIDAIRELNDEWFDTFAFPTDEGQTSIHDTIDYEIGKAYKLLEKPCQRESDAVPVSRETLRQMYQDGIFLRNTIPDHTGKWRNERGREYCLKAAIRIYQAAEGALLARAEVDERREETKQ